MTGYRNGDTATSAYSGSPALATTATESSGVSSTYPITIGSGAGAAALTSAKYNFSFVPGTLTLTRATLTVRANNATMTVGGTVPTFAANCRRL